MPVWLGALALALLLPCSAMAEPPTGRQLVQTVVTLAPGVDHTLGSNVNRSYLCLMNIDVAPLTLGFGQAAVAGSGINLGPAASTLDQGGVMCWEAGIVVSSVVHAISTVGTRVAVLEAK